MALPICFVRTDRSSPSETRLISDLYRSELIRSVVFVILYTLKREADLE